MNNYSINIIAPENVQAKIISSAKNGFKAAIKKRFAKSNPSIDKHKVQAFFEYRSVKNNFSEFTESTSDWYMSLLDKSKIVKENINSGNKIKICDVGCGRGGLIDWLHTQDSDFQYSGFDIDRVAVVKCERKYQSNNIKFYAQDVENIIAEVLGVQDLIFTINILPYVQEIEDYISSIKKIVTPNKTHLIIVDPVPSYYWNNSFGGFTINLRKTKDLIKNFENFGFELQEYIQLHGTSILNIPLIGISSLTVWKLK